MGDIKNSLPHHDAIRMLKEIEANPKAREVLEYNIIEIDNFKSPLSYTTSQAEIARGDFINSVITTFNTKFGISPEAAMLYFELDKYVSFVLEHATGITKINGIDFEEYRETKNHSHNYLVNFTGMDLERAYRSKHAGIINFLHTHLKLFPDSSRKYIKIKKKKLDAKPKLDNLSNLFQAKSWSSSLPDKFTLSFARDAISFFKKGSTPYESIISFGYAYFAISDKYPDNKLAKKYLLELSGHITHELDKLYSEDVDASAKSSQWRKFQSMLENCTELRDHVIINPSFYRNYLSIILDPICPIELKDNLVVQQKKFLSYVFDNDFFLYRDCTDQQSEQLLEDYKRQFFLKVPEYA